MNPARIEQFIDDNDFLRILQHHAHMIGKLGILANLALKSAMILLAANEARGIVLAAPVLFGMYKSGGTLMAVWIAFSCLSGIALSVAVPLFVAKKIGILQPATSRHGQVA